MASRSLTVRRGRNNRIYHKFILREIFEESADEDMDEFTLHKYLGKRKRCKYLDPLDYILNSKQQNNRVSLSKKIMRKTF